jgi:hypothetical protein
MMPPHRHGIGVSPKRSVTVSHVLSEGPRTRRLAFAKGDTMRDPESHNLDALLRSAAPVRRDPADEERVFADVWSRVQTSMNHGATPSGDALQQRRLNLIGDREVAARRRRRATRLASAALAIAVAGGGTAVAADFILTRTGQELTGWEIGAGGSGELLDKGGSDLRQVVEEVTADIPFPAGYDAQHGWALDSYGSPDPGSAITESHLRSGIASQAICTWADAWVAADNAGDAGARAAAAATLAESASWEAIRTFNEDHGEPDPMDPATGVDSGAGGSYYGWLRPLAQSAQAGDRQGVLDAVAIGHQCSFEVLPVIDADPAYQYAGLR